MYIRIHEQMRKVIGISPDQLRPVSGTVVLNKPEISTNRLEYVKILDGDTIDCAEMTAGEKTAVDNEKIATQAQFLAIAKASAIKDLERIFEFVIAQIDIYPVSEMISWAKQLEEAKAYQLDTAAPIPLITQIASERLDLGETLEARIDALVLRIINNDATFTALSGALIGRRHILEKAIKDATSVSSIPQTEEMRNNLIALLNEKLAGL